MFRKAWVRPPYGTHGLVRSSDGRYVCAFDGRIFDAGRWIEALRQKGVAVAAGDTAALFLHLYLTGGVEAFRDVEGGYAAAVLDTRDRTVVLFRDPFGVKSVYYTQTPRGVLFSSSLAALAKCDWFSRTIGMSGFLEYMAYGYVSAPWTIYEHAFGLKPGDSAAVTTKKVVITPFHALEPAGWRFADTGNQTDDQLADTLGRLLTEATQRRLPPGDSVAAYLSGGPDTSLLCAKLKGVGGRRVAAYTLGFPGGAHDEPPLRRGRGEAPRHRAPALRHREGRGPGHLPAAAPDLRPALRGHLRDPHPCDRPQSRPRL